jgi:hypothetical protein
MGGGSTLSSDEAKQSKEKREGSTLKGEAEYNLAVALLQFKTIYKKLVKASKALPDYDCSMHYPFYLLDFEELEDAVCTWCLTHSIELMKSLPDRVDNPACLNCEFFRAGLANSGMCQGSLALNCMLYPYVRFEAAQVIPFLKRRGYTDVDLSDINEIQFLYMCECDKIAKEKRNDNKSNESVRQ